VKPKTPARTFEDDPATASAQVSNQVTASFEVTASFAWTQIPWQIILAQIPKLIIASLSSSKVPDFQDEQLYLPRTIAQYRH
jgi:hypothetical protein